MVINVKGKKVFIRINMKKSLWKNNFKSILKTRRRFISILIMAFLGVGFFSGLVATSPDMLDSLDKYTDNNKMFDVDIVSTLGLTDEDIQALKNIEGIENVYGIQTKDSIADFDEKESICKVIEYNENINVPNLVTGKLPENSNECLLDSKYMMVENIEDYIGKTLVLINEDKDENDNPIFTQKEFKVVGIADTPIYISEERGNTSVGSGSISYYIYVKDDVINLDYYTELGILAKGAKEEVTNSNKYLDIINALIKNIESIKQEREDARYNSLITAATEKVNEAQKEYDEKKLEADQEIADAQKQLDDAKAEVEKSEEKIRKSENELKSQQANMQSQFNSAEEQIANAENQILVQEQELEKGKAELEKNKVVAEATINNLSQRMQNEEITIKQLKEERNELIQDGKDTTEIDKQIETSEETLNWLEEKKTEIETNIKAAQDKILIGENTLNNARSEVQSQKEQLENNKSTANKKIEDGNREIRNAKSEIESAKKEIEENEIEFENKKREAEQKLAEGQAEINEAKDKIKEIEKAKWYIYDRTDNSGYLNIFDAIKTVSNISKMFPVIFYIVAVLISLTSMTRMIEEERVEIGTLKSLGYTNFQIISKYILYSFLACIIGGTIGMTVGFYLLPNIIWTLYSIIYTIPNFYLTYQFGVGINGIIIAFICIGGATIYVAYKELKEMPATLMRPKAPKYGRKILLERIKFIWKRFSFSQKVTVRNIFRYKKRAIVTVVGIAGCTGLMLTGFGIRDSVLDLPDLQFNQVFNYEVSANLWNTNGLYDLEEYLKSNSNVEDYCKIYANTGELKNNDLSYDVNTFVPENVEEFNNICNLVSVENEEPIELNDDGIVITDKVAEFLDVAPGDEVTFVDSDNIEYRLKVTAIAENYVSHYVYMTKNFYEQNIKSFKINSIFINTIDMEKEEENKMLEEILNIEGVATASMTTTIMESIEDMLNVMNYIVIILIVSSAMLAFVVLYNLANINIGERQREIATLKVLGFFDREVDNYINKENMVFTVIGVIVGLVFGTFLTSVLIASIEIDNLRFLRNINILSYVYSALITIAFSVIVNRIIHFILKKIDMIESLKSVE